MNDVYIYNLGMLFSNIVKKYPEKKAIIWDTENYITFSELNVLANHIAVYLLKCGVKKHDVVAIQNNKSDWGFGCMIACLKIGAIYTNFDYTNPIERIRRIFETAKPKLVFADNNDDSIKELCDILGINYLHAPAVGEAIASFSEASNLDFVNDVTENDPAYIMFTSGSTGVPKGVVIKHGALINFIKWGKCQYSLREDEIFTNVNPIYFDNSVFDFYCSVFNGHSMLAVPKTIVEKPSDMLELIDKVGCTLWFSVPSMLIYLTNLRLLSKDSFSTIRIIAFGGEGYPKELLRKLYALFGDRIDFYNVYGPTEGTCICSAYHIEDHDIEADGLAPLGQIAPNFGYLILDEHDKPSNVGELCLTGSQLALGYYNDETRTNKSFVKNPLQSNYYERMYRTGDKVEYIDNKLFFRGRVDNQIKHMGYRIELEEIENAMIKVEGVKQCAAIHTLSKNNLSKIIGVIATDSNMEEAEVKSILKTYLPSYMIPNKIVFMPELPKNPNGKVDRVRLEKICSNP